jgi:hypothetical protein
MTSLKLKKTRLVATAAALILLALAAFAISPMLTKSPAVAGANSCRATCEAAFGQCYRQTANRDTCTAAYQQCLAQCIGG